MDASEMPDSTAAPPSSASESTAGDATTAPSLELARLAQLLERAEGREIEARRALNALAAIVNQLPVALTVQSDDGNTLFANDTAAAWYGAAKPAMATPTNPSENDTDGTTLSEECLTVQDGPRT